MNESWPQDEAPREPTPISSVVDDLSYNIGMLETFIDKLENRLASVCTPQSPPPSGSTAANAVDMPTSSLTSTLRSKNDYLMKLQNQIASLISRIEL